MISNFHGLLDVSVTLLVMSLLRIFALNPNLKNFIISKNYLRFPSMHKVHFDQTHLLYSTSPILSPIFKQNLDFLALNNFVIILFYSSICCIGRSSNTFVNIFYHHIPCPLILSLFSVTATHYKAQYGLSLSWDKISLFRIGQPQTLDSSLSPSQVQVLHVCGNMQC
jgi:hypothetical protein